MICLSNTESKTLSLRQFIQRSRHLVNFAKEIPIFEYNKRAVAGFNELLADIEDEIVNILSTAEITPEGINMDKAGIKAPSSTWTYLVDDNPSKLGLESVIVNPMAAIFCFPLYVILLLYYKLTKKKK